MAVQQKAGKPWLPPRWVIRFAWLVHRGLYRVTGGRAGLRSPRPGRAGTLRLTTRRG